MLYALMALVGCIFILAIEGLPLHETLFESLSAIGTVGLSRGITGNLSIASRVMIIILMYSGRVGSMSVAMAFVEHKPTAGLRNPVERIIVG